MSRVEITLIDTPKKDVVLADPRMHNEPISGFGLGNIPELLPDTISDQYYSLVIEPNTISVYVSFTPEGMNCTIATKIYKISTFINAMHPVVSVVARGVNADTYQLSPKYNICITTDALLNIVKTFINCTTRSHIVPDTTARTIAEYEEDKFGVHPYTNEDREYDRNLFSRGTSDYESDECDTGVFDDSDVEDM